jgi:hypothetical protein
VTPHFTLFRDRRVICHDDSGNLLATSPVDLRIDLRAIANGKVKLDEIPDGTSATIILSENTEAVAPSDIFAAPDNIWFNIDDLDRPGDVLPVLDDVKTRSSALVRCLGFLWSNKSVALTSNAAWTSLYTPNIQPAGGSGEFPPTERPASKHRGTVIVAYADSSVKSMDTSINAGVYLELVCPDALKAIKPVADGGLGYAAATP